MINRFPLAFPPALSGNSLPTYQFGSLEISVSYDPLISSVFLIATFRQRDSRTLEVIDAVSTICCALPIDSSTWQRNMYIRECCELIAKSVHGYIPCLDRLSKPIQVMCESWNILGVFLALEGTSAVEINPSNLNTVITMNLAVSKEQLAMLSTGLALLRATSTTNPTDRPGPSPNDIDVLEAQISRISGL